MPTEHRHILVFCTLDDWLGEHPVPVCPGRRLACRDSEILTFMLARAGMAVA